MGFPRSLFPKKRYNTNMDHTLARTHMVMRQLYPLAITDEDVALLPAFHTIPREIFVPKGAETIAYGDHPIIFDEGRFMMSPAMLYRLLIHVPLSRLKTVLIVGGGTGYSAALFSHFVPTVFLLDACEELIAVAEANLDMLDVSNVVSVSHPITAGLPIQGPFDLIVFEGALQRLPNHFLQQLQEGTDPALRASSIIAPIIHPDGARSIVTRFTSSPFQVIEEPLFEAFIPLIPEFSTPPAFVF